MVTLHEKMRAARAEWDVARGLREKPGKLLIGRMEAFELEALAARTAYGSCKPDLALPYAGLFSGSHDHRIEFNGLKVYLVDDLGYLQLAL